MADLVGLLSRTNLMTAFDIIQASGTPSQLIDRTVRTDGEQPESEPC